jgi:hypothetical protein
MPTIVPIPGQLTLMWKRYQLNSCLSILNMANEQVGSLDNPNDRAKFDSNWTKYENCQAKASALLGTMVGTSHSAPVLVILVAIDLATVLIGWIVGRRARRSVDRPWVRVSLTGRGFGTAVRTRARDPHNPITKAELKTLQKGGE